MVEALEDKMLVAEDKMVEALEDKMWEAPCEVTQDKM